MAEELLRQTVIENPYIPALYDEHGNSSFPSIPQAVFFTAPCDEILYGGAAGGGKSAGLLASGLQYVEQPGYDALIVRRSYADLEKPGGLISMSHEWLASTDAKYDGTEHRWYFPSGATLSFGHIQNVASVVQDYQGSAFGFIGFDELTQFAEFMYRYLFSRLRKRHGLMFPTRVRATGNPGGEGHDWVKREFIDGSDGFNRLYIPAKLEDNPGLNRGDYEKSLQRLDPVTRRQLRHGDWDIKPEGNLFRRDWFVDKTIERAPNRLQWVRYWDLAATKARPGRDPDYAAGCLLGIDEMRKLYIGDMQHFRENPRETEARVIATAQRDGTGVPIRIEQEPGSASKLWIDSIASRQLLAYDVRGVPSITDKLTRAKPVSAACERGDVWFIRGGWIADFLDELCSFIGDGIGHDDMVDAFTGAFKDLAGDGAAWDEDAWRAAMSYGR